MTQLTAQITAALLITQPSIKPNSAERYVSKYVAAMIQEIGQQYMLMSKDDFMAGEFDFAARRVTDLCGRAQFDGSTHYIFHLLQEHSSTAIAIEKYKGNNLAKRVSRYTLNPRYKKEIMDELINLTIELNPTYLQKLSAEANNSVFVDVDSLQNYILATRQSLQQGGGTAYTDKLTRNLLIAQQVLLQVTYTDEGSAVVHEYWEAIDSGRIQGHGISLQRIPKEVRHGALGKCFRYDFKAASYALLTGLALLIDPTLKVGALKDYIQHRSVIRKNIAKDIGISEDWMKRIFTAIGFGAQLNDSPYTMIRNKIGKEKYDALKQHKKFAEIIDQLNAVTKTISKSPYFPDSGFTLHDNTYTQINPKDGKKRTTNQKLAWIYQCLESYAIAWFVARLPADSGFLLTVHDCVYLKHQIMPTVAHDIRVDMAREFPLLNFEEERIIPIRASNKLSEQQEEQAHRERIRQEELRAANYVPVFAQISSAPLAPEPETDEEYELRRRKQFEDDVARGLSPGFDPSQYY